MPLCVHDLGLYLKGRWSLSRLVLQETLKSEMRGQVTVTKSPFGLLYHEEGRLYQKGYHGLFEQTYSLILEKTPQKAQVCHSDGVPFFLLDLSDGTQSLEHSCGDDHYRATLVAFEGCIKCRWRVVGPRKNYTLITTLRKPSNLCFNRGA